MNKVRGEAELTAAGKSHRLLLTLGALAEIEDGLALNRGRLDLVFLGCFGEMPLEP